MKQFIYTLLAAILFISCSNDKNGIKDYTAQNEKEITEYLAKNNLTAQRTDSGLYYIINEEGEGNNPTITSNVTVAYKGSLINGKVFDQSSAEGVSFPLSRVIVGWQEGIPFFKPGGSGLLLIPSHLGYGSKSNDIIPGGSVLIFEVKLLSVN